MPVTLVVQADFPSKSLFLIESKYCKNPKYTRKVVSVLLTVSFPTTFVSQNTGWLKSFGLEQIAEPRCLSLRETMITLRWKFLHLERTRLTTWILRYCGIEVLCRSAHRFQHDYFAAEGLGSENSNTVGCACQRIMSLVDGVIQKQTCR